MSLIDVEEEESALVALYPHLHDSIDHVIHVARALHASPGCPDLVRLTGCEEGWAGREGPAQLPGGVVSVEGKYESQTRRVM